MNHNEKKSSLQLIQKALKYGFDASGGKDEDIVISGKLTTHQNSSSLNLPGNGEKMDECGKWTSFLSCENHGQPTINGDKHDRFHFKHSCDRPECPVCYPTWALKLAKRASERVEWAERLYKEKGERIGYIKHTTFSPSLDYAIEAIKTVEGVRKLRSEAVEFFKKAGLKGGVVVFHPFRQNRPEKSNFNPSIPAYAWYQSPHFHVVGFGYLQNSEDFYNETGWVYKNHGERMSVRYTIYYQLTHCGINENLHALTYFGAMGYNQMIVDSESIVEEPIKCKACGEPLHKYGCKVEYDKASQSIKEVLDEDGNPVPDYEKDLGVYVHKVKIRVYKLRVPGTKRVRAFYHPGYTEIKTAEAIL